ncbi:MAG: hypothetical protein RL434_2577 [Pseudomonadota bacterium]
MTWLDERARNVHSQCGEDGVIEAIFEVISAGEPPWCVEFGAWDGIHLSNTRHLLQSANWSAVLIEGDAQRYQKLVAEYAGNSRVCPLNAWVGFGESDGLDSLLSGTPIPRDFALLSIDIDGNDYHVWKAVQVYQPRVVVIEYNPTIPTPVRFVQPADPAVQQGSSLLSLVELGREKGYELVCVLANNAIFVRAEYLAAFGLATNAPEVLRTDERQITWLFTGYDGRIFLAGKRRMIWHGVKILESDVQVLPRFLRHPRARYSLWRRLYMRFFKWWRGN